MLKSKLKQKGNKRGNLACLTTIKGSTNDCFVECVTLISNYVTKAESELDLTNQNEDVVQIFKKMQEINKIVSKHIDMQQIA